MENYNEELPVRYKIAEILLKMSAILGTLYLIYIGYVFYSTYQESTGVFFNIGVHLAFTYIMPHLICTIIAVILNIISVYVDNNALILISAILYTIAMVLLYMTFFFLILSTILMYIAFCIFARSE